MEDILPGTHWSSCTRHTWPGYPVDRGSFLGKSNQTSAKRDAFLKKVFAEDGFLNLITAIFVNIIIWGCSLAVILACILGRAYLLIECFINVGNLDSRVFLLPAWTNYLPHIG